MNDRQLHFRCSFTIKPKSIQEPNTFWSDTLRLIRGWVVEKVKEFNGSQEYLIDSWYFLGGRWQCNNLKHTKVETIRLDEIDNSTNPKFWALRFEHADKSFSHRSWVTDFVVESVDVDCLKATISLFYYIYAGYIGKEPELPMPSSPKIVRYFLSKYNCFSGDILLHENAVLLQHGKVRDLWSAIISQKRHCPIVVVRSDYLGKYPIEPNKLASLLKGTALVYQIDEQDFEEEIKHYLGSSYRDYNIPREHIRIYFPNVNLKYSKDYIKHRFFTPDNLRAFENKQEIIEIIVRSISRRFKIDLQEYIQTFEEVKQKQRELKLAELKSSNSTNAYIELLELSNKELSKEINTLKDKFNNEKENYEYSLLEVQELQLKIEDEKKKANYNIRNAYAELDKIILQKDGLENKLLQLNNLTELPKTLEDVVQILSNLHSEKLFFHKNAFATAREFKYDDVETAWQAIWHTATTLWDIYFLEEANDIPGSFKNKSGFEVALSEGSLTKENKELMEYRKLEYDGNIVDITPHIKVDRKGKNLRIYYYVDNVNKKIVIGHCGNHLPTHGTKVRKEG